MDTYIIAVKRDKRAVAPQNLRDEIGPIEGVKVVAAPTPSQVRVEASDEGIESVRREFGAVCNIEPVIEHRPSTKLP